MIEGDPFANLARFYDLDLEGYDDDVELYLALAGEAGEVLELGCGTGRVACALAAAGRRVTGVDLSAAMLERARARGGGLELIEGDMRTLDLGRGFGLVIAPLGGLQHMETVDDVVAAFATIARHLAPGGRAVVDIEAPHPDDWLPGPRPLLEHWTRPLAEWPGGGALVTKLVAVEGRPVEALRAVSYHFDVQPAEGPLQRMSEQFTLRVITAGELELAARLEGLEAVAWYGDYDGSPPREGDERVIALFERAAGAS